MFFEEAAEKCVAERSEFVPVCGLIVIRKLSEIDPAQPLNSTFAMLLGFGSDQTDQVTEASL